VARTVRTPPLRKRASSEVSARRSATGPERPDTNSNVVLQANRHRRQVRVIPRNSRSAILVASFEAHSIGEQARRPYYHAWTCWGFGGGLGERARDVGTVLDRERLAGVLCLWSGGVSHFLGGDFDFFQWIRGVRLDFLHVLTPADPLHVLIHSVAFFG
jgi:hypothetical protein